MDVRQRIAAWREAKGLSQHELAERVGVTYAAVFQWESKLTKRTTPSVATIEKIAKAFGLSMSEFYGPLPRKRRAS